MNTLPIKYLNFVNRLCNSKVYNFRLKEQSYDYRVIMIAGRGMGDGIVREFRMDLYTLLRKIP